MIERIFPPTQKAHGPYAPAVRAGDFLYVSGQGPVDPSSNKMSFGDIRHETRLVLENVRRILEHCGCPLSQVVKCTVYLAHAGDFEAMNTTYREFFGEEPPARTTVQATLVEPGMKIEIDCVAFAPSQTGQ